MKKIITFLALSVLFSLCIVGLAACDKPTEQTHEHNYTTEWSYNENSHWHACTISGCTEISDKAPHTFEEITENETLYQKCTVCDYKIEITTEEHEHTYSESFSFDEDYHWHACAFDGCTVKSDLAEHVFDNPEITQTNNSITRKYICAYCGYEKIETITVETIIQNEEKWQDAFTNLKLLNYSLRVTFKYGYTTETHNECRIDENGAYVSYGDGELINYFIKNKDGSFSNYGKSGNTPWVKANNNTSIGYDNIITEATLPFSLEDNFDTFIYDEEKGAYLSTEEMLIDAYKLDSDGKEYVYDTLCAFNAEVKVIDGAISYISSEYYFPNHTNDSTQYSFTYWNIGMTKVVLPAEVAKTAIPETDYTPTNSEIEPTTPSEPTEEPINEPIDEPNTPETPNEPNQEQDIYGTYYFDFCIIEGTTINDLAMISGDTDEMSFTMSPNGVVTYRLERASHTYSQDGTWRYINGNEYVITMESRATNIDGPDTVWYHDMTAIITNSILIIYDIENTNTAEMHFIKRTSEPTEEPINEPIEEPHNPENPSTEPTQEQDIYGTYYFDFCIVDGTTIYDMSVIIGEECEISIIISPNGVATLRVDYTKRGLYSQDGIWEHVDGDEYIISMPSNSAQQERLPDETEPEPTHKPNTVEYRGMSATIKNGTLILHYIENTNTAEMHFIKQS